MTAVALDTAAAERRAERIRLRLDTIADNYATVLPMIREAIEARDFEALGYVSVSAYVEDRFGGALTKLGIDVRREVVRELTAAGMSSRAIAPVVGVSQGQVSKDRQVIPQESPAPVVDRETGEVLQPAGAPVPVITEDGPAPAPRPIQGRDGKTYTRPAPRPETPERAAQREALAELTATPADVEYRQNFRKAYRAALTLAQFDPERVGQVIDADDFDLLERLPRSLTAFVGNVRAARPRNLRSVK